MTQIVNVNSRVIYSLLFFVLLMILIAVSKPSIVFNPDGSLKEFGIGDDKTMFSLGVFTVVVAIISFYTFCIIDLVFKNI
jgi:hypothetical protein